MPPWPGGAVPAGLPPFPGPGWVYDTPPSAAVIARAQYWNPLLWNYASHTIKQPFAVEQFGGRWMAFKAETHQPGNLMATTAWRLKSAAPIAVPAPLIPPPPGTSTPPIPGPAPVHPAPAPGQPAPPPGAPVPPSPPAAAPAPITHPAAPYTPAAAPPVVPMSPPLTARQVQHALNIFSGLASGGGPQSAPFPLAEDGQLGAFLTPADVAKALAHTLGNIHNSRQAIVLYQHANGLRTDSDAGPQTQGLMRDQLAASALHLDPHTFPK
jgi:hypothetical protein